MNDELPNYVEMERALGRVDVDYSGAEVHGICCGMLAVNQAIDQQLWLAQVVEGASQDFLVQETRKLLQRLWAATRQQLNAPEMEFALFLPEDDDLAAQVEAMQDWCQGFGFGLAAAGIKDMQVLPTDSREWAEDVVRIGSAGELDLDDAEASEDALAEIIEYLRVGVLMMTEEMQPLKAAPRVH